MNLELSGKNIIFVMKEYRFDYIRETVESWREDIPRTIEFIEGVPFGLFIYSQPSVDPYGEMVDDFDEWYRHEYCLKLAEEYRNEQSKF